MGKCIWWKTLHPWLLLDNCTNLYIRDFCNYAYDDAWSHPCKSLGFVKTRWLSYSHNLIINLHFEKVSMQKRSLTKIKTNFLFVHKSQKIKATSCTGWLKRQILCWLEINVMAEETILAKMSKNFHSSVCLTFSYYSFFLFHFKSTDLCFTQNVAKFVAMIREGSQKVF